MNYLLDTQILLWAAAGDTGKLSRDLTQILTDDDNKLWFSAASIWEVTIKSGLGRADFQVDPSLLRRGLLDGDYLELAITSQHAVAVARLPSIHKDPFDRLLIAQATVNGFILLTADELVGQYPGPIRRI